MICDNPPIGFTHVLFPLPLQAARSVCPCSNRLQAAMLISSLFLLIRLPMLEQASGSSAHFVSTAPCRTARGQTDKQKERRDEHCCLKPV